LYAHTYENETRTDYRWNNVRPSVDSALWVMSLWLRTKSHISELSKIRFIQ